jgi:hypothetical protein
MTVIRTENRAAGNTGNRCTTLPFIKMEVERHLVDSLYSFIAETGF